MSSASRGPGARHGHARRPLIAATTVDKLAIQTADLAFSTHDKMEEQGQRVEKVADVPGERVRAAELTASLENWATARLSPRRRRSAKLAAFDERVGELEGRMGELMRPMTEIRNCLPHADAEYRERSCGWRARGSKGSRRSRRSPSSRTSCVCFRRTIARARRSWKGC